MVQTCSTTARLVRSFPPPILYCSPTLALPQGKQNAPTVVFNVQPITDVLSIAIDWEGFALKSVQKHQRNKFFRKLIWAIIIGTTRDQRMQTIRLVIGSDKMIRTRL